MYSLANMALMYFQGTVKRKIRLASLFMSLLVHTMSIGISENLLMLTFYQENFACHATKPNARPSQFIYHDIPRKFLGLPLRQQKPNTDGSHICRISWTIVLWLNFSFLLDRF